MQTFTSYDIASYDTSLASLEIKGNYHLAWIGSFIKSDQHEDHEGYSSVKSKSKQISLHGNRDLDIESKPNWISGQMVHHEYAPNLLAYLLKFSRTSIRKWEYCICTPQLISLGCVFSQDSLLKRSKSDIAHHEIQNHTGDTHVISKLKCSPINHSDWTREVNMLHPSIKEKMRISNGNESILIQQGMYKYGRQKIFAGLMFHIDPLSYDAVHY